MILGEVVGAGEADLDLYQQAEFCAANADCSQRSFNGTQVPQAGELPNAINALVADTETALDTITRDAPNADVVLVGQADFLTRIDAFDVPGINTGASPFYDMGLGCRDRTRTSDI